MRAPTFILDGSNLAWLGPGDGAALAPIDAIADTLRAEWPGCKVITLCDASLRHRLDEQDRAEHGRRTKAGTLVEAPADEDADAYILAAARQLDACVVTRDLYRDRRAERAGVPMLRPALIGGAVILGEPKVFAQADDERSVAVDPAAFGARVSPGPLPGGAPLQARRVRGGDEEEGEGEDDEGDEDEDDDEDAESERRPVARPRIHLDRASEPEAEEFTPNPASSEADEAFDEVTPAAKPPRGKASAKTSANAPAKAAGKASAKTPAKAAAKATAKTPAKTSVKASAPAPPVRQTVLGAVILLTLAAGLAALGWWLFADATPPPRDPGVYFVRGCRAWILAAGEERIAVHARPGECITSVAAIGPDRLAMTSTDGAGSHVTLIAGDAREQTFAVATGAVTTATLLAADDEHVLVRLEGASVGAGGGGEAGEAEAVLYRHGGERVRRVDTIGAAVAGARAVVVHPRCPGGCAGWHLAAGSGVLLRAIGAIGDATDAADAATDATDATDATPNHRFLGPAALEPAGRRLALVALVDGEPAVLIVDPEAAPPRTERVLLLPGRWARAVDGIAWTDVGLFVTGGDALLLHIEGSDWQQVTSKARRASPAQ